MARGEQAATCVTGLSKEADIASGARDPDGSDVDEADDVVLFGVTALTLPVMRPVNDVSTSAAGKAGTIRGTDNEAVGRVAAMSVPDIAGWWIAAPGVGTASSLRARATDCLDDGPFAKVDAATSKVSSCETF